MEFQEPIESGLESALKIETKNNTWVDIVFQVLIPAPTKLQPPHPIHKHPDKAFLMAVDRGQFTWKSLAEASAQAQSPQSFLEKPIYRDTFVTSPIGPAWIAIGYHVENPSAFHLHCHLETHLASGMGLILLDGIDAWPQAAAVGKV